jgi:hypothetical protein
MYENEKKYKKELNQELLKMTEQQAGSKCEDRKV